MPPVPLRSLETRRGWAMVLAVAALAVASTFLRQSGVPKADTIWAEDAAVFAQCAYDQSPLSCVVVPYQGYLHTAPRLGALVVPVGDPASLPFRLTTVAAAIAAVAAVLAALAVAQVTSSAAMGFLAGAGFVLVYPAGREVSGNLTNVHWILFAASVTVIVCSWLGRRPRPWDLALLALTALTSAFGPMLVPLALITIARRTRWAVTMSVVTIAAALPQLLVIVASPRVSSTRAPVGLMALFEDIARMITRVGWFGPNHAIGNRAVVVLAGVLLLALAVVRPRSADERPDTPGRFRAAVPALAVAALPAIGIVAFALSVLLNRILHPDRYAYVPATLFVVAIALAAGLLADRITDERSIGRWPHGRWRSLIAFRAVLVGVITIGFGVGFAVTFQVRALASPGPDAHAEIELQSAACLQGDAAITVPVSPVTTRHWHVDIPCDEFAPR